MKAQMAAAAAAAAVADEMVVTAAMGVEVTAEATAEAARAETLAALAGGSAAHRAADRAGWRGTPEHGNCMLLLCILLHAHACVCVRQYVLSLFFGLWMQPDVRASSTKPNF